MLGSKVSKTHASKMFCYTSLHPRGTGQTERGGKGSFQGACCRNFRPKHFTHLCIGFTMNDKITWMLGCILYYGQLCKYSSMNKLSPPISAAGSIRSRPCSCSEKCFLFALRLCSVFPRGIKATFLAFTSPLPLPTFQFHATCFHLPDWATLD